MLDNNEPLSTLGGRIEAVNKSNNRDAMWDIIVELQGVVDDLWICVDKSEIDMLRPETVEAAKEIHERFTRGLQHD